ncbi:hypothetical protein AYL99_12001 [Fonsecaea erecta]|uniref:Alpha/beta hydrolase fold-3 domain-containing protein n=1 Tax=Fonsecaea erecta TaxID=1367422 RepID=A0A178Z1V8_9EURO|nr:hypothetical protein AYL99_12001 [Fonsecaea erecta]OAP53782.1 hypothetical protein AYL99_12001 [Fonsecaea erecta]
MVNIDYRLTPGRTWLTQLEDGLKAYKWVNGSKTEVPIINKKSMEMFNKYAGVDPKHSDVLTALSTDNGNNFSPVYFASCETDPLRDDSYVMGAALQKADVPTKHDHYEGLLHYVWIFP